MTTISLFIVTAWAALAAQPLPSWDFTNAGTALTWQPNAHLTDVTLRDGALHATGAGHDPIFSIDGLGFPAKANQYLLLEIAADRPGRGEVFFTGTTEGPYGGFSQAKSVDFQVGPQEGMQQIAIFPFWQREGRVIRLRLDLYDGARFRIAGLCVVEAPVADAEGQTTWTFTDGLPAGWLRLGAEDRTYWGLFNGLSAESLGWLALRVAREQEAGLEVRWAARDGVGFETLQAHLRGGAPRWYNVELQGEPQWKGDIAAVGLVLPPGTTLEEVRLADSRVGPADMVVDYFGPEAGANRPEREVNVLARFRNIGGATAPLPHASLSAPDTITTVYSPEDPGISLAPGAYRDVRWGVRAAEAGEYPLAMRVSGGDTAHTVLRVLPPVDVSPSDYVPEPRPVETVVDVCAYYFPGWGREAAWEPIRGNAPGRKPVLGWYDESNPEVVDWQVKWAVENGITCFLVDWYWVDGSQHLTHWFEAYREARYRDELDVAIMWANHNPPGTHSMDDWRAVTQEWLDNYFDMPTYYHVDGMPALFFWSPTNLRDDLGGTEKVKEALAMSQQMAREAGHEGIAFIAMFDHDTPEQAARLLAEGYHGATNYHEWGDAEHMGDTPKRYRFADVVETSPAAWARREEATGDLHYYPVADTGWDARPWHGPRARVFAGRTPDLWEKLLRDLKHFAQKHDKPFVVLGPLNEWGEGSYIEPAAEYDFAMYEAIRRVFAKGDQADWPINITPRGAGLGPYDFPETEHVTAWDFETAAGGWSAMMGMGNVMVAEGALLCHSATTDAALTGPLMQLDAAAHDALEIRMRSTASTQEARDTMQLFWSDGGGTSEAESIRVPVTHDGAWHTYRFDLAGHPRWRGTITGLRLDPTILRGVEIEIDRIAFTSAGGNG